MHGSEVLLEAVQEFWENAFLKDAHMIVESGCARLRWIVKYGENTLAHDTVTLWFATRKGKLEYVFITFCPRFSLSVYPEISLCLCRFCSDSIS
jgi:hypothetical protein